MADAHHHHQNGGSSSKRPRSSTGDNNNHNDQGGSSSKRQRTEAHAQDTQNLDPLGFPNVDAFGHPQLDYNNYVAPMATMQQYNMPPPTATATATSAGNPAAPNGVSSSYGATYQGSLPANVPRSSTRSGLKIGPLTLEQAQLAIPGHLSPADKEVLKTRLQDELNRQRAHPPALPRSEVSGLPPKEFMPEYKKIEEHFTPELKARIRTFNARISEELQRIDRERNNQAAKKSRETRLEALRLTRDMLNKKTAERDWLRLKVLQLQGEPNEYDALPDQTRRRLVEVVETRVREIDQTYAEEKKQEESRKRAERTRLRAEARELEAMTPDYFLNEIVPPEEALTAIVGEDGTYIDKEQEEDGEGEPEQQLYADGGGVLDEHVLERTLYGGGHHGHTLRL
ncbi:uncharacterized protein J7T54_002317 [Emericellopsis cladophorae]|uniref:Uncharacterized protein n=1 Tax=Emericellopsis cladophorae TaxID=2686198 RepID=A0A9P9Y1W8_9HYPO|nr:uncharacterized protein J7T54_002317 [Emericellopsis cladophorae]KAI6781424.1 hypothetical protein J7T54_002317 [Emericellopsis cladophorae]